MSITRCRTATGYAAAISSLALLLVASCAVGQTADDAVANVRPFYVNTTPPTEPGTTKNGAAPFGGHVGDATSSRYILRTSSFGQPLSRYMTSPTYLADAVNLASQQLYYIPGASADQNARAAFRYINTFYAQGPTTIEQRLDNSTPYNAAIDSDPATETDEERAIRVANDIKELLRFAPFDRDLRNLLLDIYYYRTLGRQTAAKSEVVRAYQINFSEEVGDSEPFGGPINKEIKAYEEAAAALSGVLEPYTELLFDKLGVNIREFDPTYGGSMPFGYYMFNQEVPHRAVTGASFIRTDATGTNLVAVDEEAPAGQLVVTPTSFSVDYLGRPSGSTQSAISFTINNPGTETLYWRATVESPLSDDPETAMLSIVDTTGDAVSTISRTTSAGGSTIVTINVGTNYSSLMRLGKIRIEDTVAGSNAMTLRAIIAQQPCTVPLIGASLSQVVFRPILNEGYQQQYVLIRNAGMGTLNWRATLMAPASGDSWVTLSVDGGEESSDYVEGSQGVGANVLCVRQLLGTSYPQMAIRITSTDNPEVAALDIPVTVTPLDEYMFAPTKSLGLNVPLLSVYPENIRMTAEGGTAPILVVNGLSAGLDADSSASWVTVDSIDTTTGIISITINENTTVTSREALITVTGQDTAPETRTISVFQDGTTSDVLNVTPDFCTVGQAAGSSGSGVNSKSFKVTPTGAGSINWDARVTRGQDWLTITSSATGTGPGELTFSYDTNPHVQARVGEITIGSPDAAQAGNVVVVTVRQKSASGAASLSVGYKDLALIFDVLRDEAQVKKELAKRYAMRRLEGDLERANLLISKTLTRHTTALNDIGGLTDWRDNAPPSSDLWPSFAGWQQAVQELNTLKDFINGDSNVLGFPESFLFMVQNFPGQDASLYDSFDKLYQYMVAGSNSVAASVSPLGYAEDKYQAARSEYETFVTTQDQLATEFDGQNSEHRQWMFDVVGVDPGNDVDHPDNADAYNNPDANEGCEIWVQSKAIEQARERVKQNQAELDRIAGEITTEIWRRGQEQQISASIADVHYEYQTQIADLELSLGAIEGAQQFLDNVAEACNSDSLVGGIAYGVNAAAQYALTMGKAELTRQQSQLSAEENKEVAVLEDSLLEVEHKAKIAELKGQATVTAVQSGEVGIALIQAIGERQSLIDEWHYRENLMRENNAALLNRSFANPVYRQRMRRSMIEAEASFKTAQRWVFFTIRALEYKWNVPFVYASNTGEWSVYSVFRCRTAKDLRDLLAAVKDFDGIMQGSARTDDHFDWFSFKGDFMGLKSMYAQDGVTEVKYYAHPNTGYLATATDIFRTHLREAYDAKTGVITLPFSTVRDNGESFYRGPIRDEDDPSVVISRGQYLDKIVWMKVNLIAPDASNEHNRVSGMLTYSGNAYVRNPRVGLIADPSRPNLIADEFTLWPTKQWYYDSGMPYADPPRPAAWRYSDTMTSSIMLNLTRQPHVDMPETVTQIETFAERSVACDRWTLKLFTRIGSREIASIDTIDDIEILFYHRSAERPPLPGDK